VHWSEQKNIRWKTPLPGVGQSTPIVWGDQIFLTAAIPIGEGFAPRPSPAAGAHDNRAVTHRQQFVVLSVDRGDGHIRWQRTVHEAIPEEQGHVSATLASASPATDGERVYAFFGSFGLHALDMTGALVWQKDLGRMAAKHGHGEGASATLHAGALAVNWDHEGQSFVVVLDARTGDERWRKQRDEVTSWATPIVVEWEGRNQLIVPGSHRVRAYDLQTGEVIWECGGLSKNIVASPVAGEGMVFLGSSYEIRSMLGIRLAGAKGDVTGTSHVAWTRRKGTPYVPSPLLSRGKLHFLRHYQNVLTQVDPKTGLEPSPPLRIPGLRNIYASPVAADGRIYITDREGVTVVLQDGTPPRPLATNRLDEGFSASVALVDDLLLLRGEHHLYAISEALLPDTTP